MRTALGIIAAIVAAAGPAHAQSNDLKGLAEQLFTQARNLIKADKWAEACPKFEASLNYDPVLGTRLNLAACYEHVGRLASAWSLYRESSELAKQVGDEKRRAYALKQASALEPRLAKMTISVPDSSPVGLVVTRDGTQIDTSALNIALYVDAGPHELKASAPGFESFTRTVTLIDGKDETVAIPNLTIVPVSKPDLSTPQVTNHAPKVGTTRLASQVRTPSTRKSAREGDAALSPTRKYVAIGIGASGAASMSIGFLFGEKANTNYADAQMLCGSKVICSSPKDYDKAKGLVNTSRSDATLSTVLVAAGGAAIVGGVITYLVRPRAREGMATRIVPVAHDRGGGLVLTGGF
jgi:hypothetical protein